MCMIGDISRASGLNRLGFFLIFFTLPRSYNFEFFVATKEERNSKEGIMLKFLFSLQTDCLDFQAHFRDFRF